MCGIVGAFNRERQASADLFVACTAMQHRGKESGGIATYNECTDFIESRVDMGEMAQVFSKIKASSLRGRVGVGHTRYSNTGSSSLHNAQPMSGDFGDEEFFFAHNGQITNMGELLEEFEDYETQGRDCSDTRLVVDLISTSSAHTFQEALEEILLKLRGAFCFVVLYKGEIYAMRDPYGVHPLQIGRRGDDYVIASESCAIDHLEVEDSYGFQEARLVRDVRPGEMIIIGKSGLRSHMWTQPKALKFDIFEIIYFLRPDSRVHGVRAGSARRRMGYYLAEEHPTDGLIVPIKSSGETHAWGHYLRLKELGHDVEYEPDALIRPNTSGRVWVMPYEEQRQEYLRIKFNIMKELVSGRDVTLVDDSIVRGTTITRIIALCRRAGARSVHVRSGSPQYLWPDIYGNDTYKDYLKGTLIARRMQGDVQLIAQEIGADSLEYLSLEKTKQAILDVAEPGSPFTMDSFHDAVFTGVYALGKGDFQIS